jgi:flagellar basal-body rod protein FlgB
VKIFDRTLGTLEKALDARLLRHNVLAGNLANADTPGFVPRDVDFAAAMRQQLSPQVPGDVAPAPSPAASGAPILLASYSPGGASVSAPARDLPLSLGDATAGGGLGSPVISVQGTGAGLDGNAVDVDRALAAVAENAIQYGAAARAAQKKLAILRYAASDGAA